MPNNYEATDPKTGQKWTWDGQKWNAVKDSSFHTFEKSVAGGLGFDPEKLQKYGAPEALREFTKNTSEWMDKVLKDPAHLLDPIHGIASGLETGGKELLGGEFSKGSGHVIGSLAGIGAGVDRGAAFGDIAETGRSVRIPSGKPVARSLFGVGKRDVEAFTEKAVTKEEEAHAKALDKVEKAKRNYAEAVQDAVKKRAEASAKETAAKTKQEALASKHGPVYKRMNEMADTAQQHISTIEQKVGEAESKKWSEFSERMDNAPVKTQGVVDTINDVQKEVLTGETLPIFRQILTEITKDEAPEFIDTAGGLVPKGTEIALDLARRFYTKIGRKLGGTELPRDVTRALAKVGDSLDSGIAESVATKGGPEALRDYRKLQADWKQYRQTFSDRDSPLRKISEAKDPSTKLGPITGETGARAIEYLGRYRDMGAQPEQLGKIRALHKALKELPGTGAKPPGMPKRPSLPEVPEVSTVTPEEARRSILESKAGSYSGPPSRFEIMFPKSMIFRRGLKALIQNPKFREWLASDNPSTPVP